MTAQHNHLPAEGAPSAGLPAEGEIRIGIYVCHFQFAAQTDGQAGDTAVRDMKVVELSGDILHRYLKRNNALERPSP